MAQAVAEVLGCPLEHATNLLEAAGGDPTRAIELGMGRYGGGMKADQDVRTTPMDVPHTATIRTSKKAPPRSSVSTKTNTMNSKHKGKDFGQKVPTTAAGSFYSATAMAAPAASASPTKASTKAMKKAPPVMNVPLNATFSKSSAAGPSSKVPSIPPPTAAASSSLVDFTHPAAMAAKRAVQSVLEQPAPKGKLLRRLSAHSHQCSPAERVKKNREVAIRLGFVPNEEVMQLPYNTAAQSSMDARSLEQSMMEYGDDDRWDRSNDTLREDLEIFPPYFWSMGKSFHANQRDKYFLRMEADHAAMFPYGDKSLERKLGRDSPRGLIAWALPLPSILGTQTGYWRSDRFLALCYFLGCPLLDRTDTFNCELGLKLVNLYPIPRLHRPFSKDLDTIMLERAHQALALCKRRNNAQIYILWSGGIDTTAMICAFLRATQRDHETRRLLVVRYAHRSIDEHPAFFYDVITKHLRHEPIAGHVRDVFNVADEAPDYQIPLVVTGDPADMLFGTFRMAEGLVGGKYSLSAPWRRIVPMLLHERRLLLDTRDYHDKSTGKFRTPGKGITKSASKEWVTWMEKQVREAPIPIVSMFDWWWWITYSCKYNHDLHRIYYNRKDISPALRRRVFNFYDSPDFHQYSLHAHNEKMLNLRVWASYKYPLKKFILDFLRTEGLVTHNNVSDIREVFHKTVAEKDSSQHLSSSNRTVSSSSRTMPLVETWTDSLDHHTVYFLSKIKVPSVSNSFGMEVGIDSGWNVIKFGACSISGLALQREGECLHEHFTTTAAKKKREGDSHWVMGRWERAKDCYFESLIGPNSINTQYQLSSCDRALRIQSKGKSIPFKHTEKVLQRRNLEAVASHRQWDDDRDHLVLPDLWAYSYSSAGE